jgi:hypothetical protein
LYEQCAEVVKDISFLHGFVYQILSKQLHYTFQHRTVTPYIMTAYTTTLLLSLPADKLLLA